MRIWPRLALGRHGTDLAVLLVFWSLLLLVGSLWWWLPLRPSHQWQTPGPLSGRWVSDSGRTLVTSHEGRPSTVWDVPSGRLRATLPDHLGPAGSALCWISADDRVAAYPSKDATTSCLRVRDLVADQERFVLPDFLGAVEDLLAGGDTLRLSDHTFVSLRTGEQRPCPAELAELLANQWEIRGWNPGWKPRRLLLVQWVQAYDYSVAVWDLASQTFLLPPRVVTGPGGNIHPYVNLDPGGNRLALLSGPAVEIWDLERGQVLATLAEPGKWKVPYVFSPDGNRLIVFTAKHVYNVETPNEKEEVWDVASAPPRLLGTVSGCASFSSDSRWALSHYQGTRWDTTSPTSMQPQSCRFRFDSDPLGYDTWSYFSADGRFLVGRVTDRPYLLDWLPVWLVGKPGPRQRLQVVDMAGQQEMAPRIPLPGEEPMNSRFWLAALESGPRLLTFQQQGLVQVWDLPPRRPVLVDYGLPLLFGLLVLAAGWQARRLLRPRADLGRHPIARSGPIY